MHSNDSQIGGFSFLLLRMTYLGNQREKQWSLLKKCEKNDPQPDTLISFTSVISWLYHTLHFFRQTAGFISAYYRHLRTSQALLGSVGFYERNRLFQDFTSSIHFPLEEVNDSPEMPVINCEGTVGFYNVHVCFLEMQTPSAKFMKPHGWNLSCWDQWKIPAEFGKVRLSLSFLSYHYTVLVQ